MMFGRSQCERIQLLLWDYAGDRLSLADRQRVDRHLQTCLQCREHVAADGRLLERMAAFREQPIAAAPPPGWNCATPSAPSRHILWRKR